MSVIEIPGYTILKTLGVGGQATVYLAIQKGFERQVALKVMSPALAADPSFGERFIREAKIVANLSHKSIVTVYDVGESGHFYYLAMEYLPGGDLKSFIEKGMKVRKALHVIKAIAKALNFAHDKGYIHRDVKSENILFDVDGLPALTDFGIAKASNSATQMTQTGKLIGTPEYMSPEQCQGKKVDGCSDLYSLGIVLYEILTKQVPFQAEDSVAVCIKHVTSPIPKLPVRLKHLQWLIDLLLAKESKDRIQSGLLLSEAISRYEATGECQSAVPSVSDRGGVGHQSQVRPQSSSPVASKALKTRLSNAVSVSENMSALASEPEFSDELRTEQRFHSSVIDSKNKTINRMLMLLFLSGILLGYFTHEQWKTPVYGWFNQNVMSYFTHEAASETADKQDNTLLTSDEARFSGVDRTADPKKLLLEADSLVQLRPHQLKAIKESLKLVAAVNTLEPGNKSAKLIYQNIISVCLAEALSEAEKNQFTSAEQWILLVEYEQPDNALLRTVKSKVAQLSEDYQLKESQRLAEQQQIEKWLVAANKALLEKRLSSPEHDNAVDLFQSVLKIEPDNTSALEGIEKVASSYRELIDNAIKEKSFSRASAYLEKFNALSVEPSEKVRLKEKIVSLEKKHKAALLARERKAAIREKKKKLERERQQKLNDPIVQMQLQGNLSSAKDFEKRKMYVLPAGNNALEKYNRVLAIDSRNKEATEGISRIEREIIGHLSRAIKGSDKALSNQWLTQLKLLNNEHPQFEAFKQRVLSIKN